MQELIEQAGFQRVDSRLVDRAAQASKAKSFAKAAVCRASEFQAVRSVAGVVHSHSIPRR